MLKDALAFFLQLYIPSGRNVYKLIKREGILYEKNEL